MRKTTALKNLIRSPQLEFIMEAHNGLSAKIVEETGFKGIWASGLSISAALGVRDNNEASWTQILEVLEFMSDKSKIPILMDGDTGHGNFNNMRRLVKKLEQRDIAGICIEDKLFPKTNSFIDGDKQPLATVEEFCGKIKAAKDTQMDDDFVVIARTEAFIAGWGLAEALKRAEAYRQAGADAVLIHSKNSQPDEIVSFMKEWGNRHPVVIVPTKFYNTPTEVFEELKVSLAIWANHNVRAIIKAMQETSRQIFLERTLRNVEKKVVPVSEIFRLQGADELKEAEKKYLPDTANKFNSIILAAGRGFSLGKLTWELPRTLLKINGKTLLENQIECYNKSEIKDITVVRGFSADRMDLVNINRVDNDIYYRTKALYSLYLARENIRDNTIISYGSINFKEHVLEGLLEDEDDITILVDTDFGSQNGEVKDYVFASEPFSRKLFGKNVRFVRMFSNVFGFPNIHGEFIGMWKVNQKGARIVKDTMEKLSGEPDFEKMRLSHLFNEISKTHPISVKYVHGGWLDIYTMADLIKAEELL